jgi:hypothetical protein
MLREWCLLVATAAAIHKIGVEGEWDFEKLKAYNMLMTCMHFAQRWLLYARFSWAVYGSDAILTTCTVCVVFSLFNL